MSEDNTADSRPAGISGGPNARWERDVLEKVLLESVREQRIARRWGTGLKLAFLGYLSVALWLAFKPFSAPGSGKTDEHTAVVDISGMIADGSKTNADSIIKGLKAAVEAKGTRGIILDMNTPGGTPVQAAYIYEEIREIKKAHPKLPVFAVVSDLCASGGYYIAAAADKIFVNPSSIVGSIGVIMNGFGFVGTMEKLGVERRALTAGDHKALLDPFSPVNPTEKAHIQKVLDSIHLQFVAAVREGRGNRLKEQPDMFSGLVWTGGEAIELGLVDGYGNVRSVAEKEIGAAERVNYTPKEDLLERLSQRIGTAFGSMIAGDGFGVRLR